MRKLSLILLLLLAGLSCSKSKIVKDNELTHIQLFDRNGVSETITKKERLLQSSNIDFLKNQPYEKVVRVYKRDAEGRVSSILTSYHENGEIYQYLEVLGGRARGAYKEWYPNGNKRIEAHLMEGIGDLSIDAQTSWIFDGYSKVYHENGEIHAELFYDKGKLNGLMKYYDEEGRISKTIPYKNDLIEGEKKIFSKEGGLIASSLYEKNILSGVSFHLGNDDLGAFNEEYENGLLKKGVYYNFSGAITHRIEDGFGVKPFYAFGCLVSEEAFKNAKVEGVCKFYRKNGSLDFMFTMLDDEKNGPMVFFYEKLDPEKNPLKRASIDYKDGEISGKILTWYPNGQLESEKEMVSNQKNGLFLAWYEDGSLMMKEEYENDVLVHGKYLKKGQDVPVSRVVHGNGLVTLFDSKGTFLKKVSMEKGVPSE